jgi:hypothetical protein
MARVDSAADLGGIWEIIFSLPSGAGASCWVIRGVGCCVDARFPARSGGQEFVEQGHRRVRVDGRALL